MSGTLMAVGIACLLGFHGVMSGQAAPQAEKPQPAPSHYPEATAAAPPSAEDTVAYINKMLHQYPTKTFSNSACQGFEYQLSIAEDKKSLVIKRQTPVDDDCNYGTVDTLPVVDLVLGTPTDHQTGYVGSWQSGVDSSRKFFLECENNSECISSSDIGPNGKLSEPSTLRIDALQVTAPGDVCEKLGRAIRHLVLLLRSKTGTDPFASPPSSN